MASMFAMQSAGYDGASQFAGGGFMPSQGAQAGSAQKKGSYEGKQTTLRALTIKQLHDAAAAAGAGDGLSVDGREVTNVTLVGRITRVEEQQLMSVYTLDDGTGTIAAKYWIPEAEDDAERAAREEWRAGVYVRAHGHLSQFNGERMLVAFCVRPIADFNEVTYHALQCIFQHQHLVGGGGGGGHGQVEAAAQAPHAQAAAPSGAAFGAHGLAPVQADVLAAFAAVGGASDVGASLSAVVAHAGGRYSRQQVQAAVEVLQNEGHLYSTIDDEHFKPCN